VPRQPCKTAVACTIPTTLHSPVATPHHTGDECGAMVQLLPSSHPLGDPYESMTHPSSPVSPHAGWLVMPLVLIAGQTLQMTMDFLLRGPHKKLLERSKIVLICGSSSAAYTLSAHALQEGRCVFENTHHPDPSDPFCPAIESLLWSEYTPQTVGYQRNYFVHMLQAFIENSSAVGIASCCSLATPPPRHYNPPPRSPTHPPHLQTTGQCPPPTCAGSFT
jgi:hypothetical protein